MIARESALTLLRKYLKTENTIKHLLATEAIMMALAEKFEPENVDEWGMAGLLHDIDYEIIPQDTKAGHGKESVKILQKEGVDIPQSVLDTIHAHCWSLYPEFEPKNKMEWSLFICDSLTGLITATAFVRPSRKLADVKLKSIKKKYKQPSFAAGTRRDEIAMCGEKLGIQLDDFIELSLTAMKGIADDLGL